MLDNLPWASLASLLRVLVLSLNFLVAVCRPSRCTLTLGALALSIGSNLVKENQGVPGEPAGQVTMHSSWAHASYLEVVVFGR